MDDGSLQPGETISPRKIENKSVPQRPVAKTSEKSTESVVAAAPIETPVIAPVPVVESVDEAKKIGPALAQKESVASEAQTQQAEVDAEADKFADDYPDDYEEPETITWTASEFVAHEKSANWYFVLILVAIVVSALTYFITKDKISVGVVIFGAIFMSIYASRKPRQLDYAVDGRGISIGQRYYDFEEFRSFGIIPEGAFSSIVFMPHKRFAIPINIYYPPDQEDKIANAIGLQLPMEDHKHDAVDRLLKSIRF